MSSKAEVLEKVVSTNNYIGSKVKVLINAVTCEESQIAPSVFKRGDLIRVRVQSDGSDKPRPSVVIKVCKDYVISLPLTTCDDVNTLCPHKGSRFTREGFFCNSYVITTLDRAKIEYLGIFDNNKCLNNAIKKLREFITEKI